jgi:hypothetical protein
MIGKRIKGFKQLLHILEDGKPAKISYLNFRNEPCLTSAMLINGDKNIRRMIILSENTGNVLSLNLWRCTKYYYGLIEMFGHDKETFGCTVIQDFGLKKSERSLSDIYDKNYGIILISENEEKKITDFNKALAKIFKYPVEELSTRLYFTCDGSLNYAKWAYLLFNIYGIPFNVISEIMIWAKKYPQAIQSLSKHTLTAYKSNDIFGENGLLQEIYTLRDKHRTLKAINQFNTCQKKILKKIKLTENDIKSFSKFSLLSLTKRTNFIKKVSSITDGNEILRLLHCFTDTNFEWNKKSLLSVISNHQDKMDCKIILDRGNIVVIEVCNFDAIKILGKNTGWCISKDLSFWTQYYCKYKNTHQYVIFNFSKKEDDRNSIIGITSALNQGIIFAHNYLNENIMQPKKVIPSFFSKYVDIDVYSILKKDNIDVSLIAPYSSLSFQWNRKSFLEYYCNELKNMQKIMDKNNVLIFRANNEDIYSIIEKMAIHQKNNPIPHSSNNIILIADFNMAVNNPEKITICVLDVNFKSQIETCKIMYNSYLEEIPCQFDTIMDKYDLPYDVICRPDTLIDKFNNYFRYGMGYKWIGYLSSPVIKTAIMNNHNKMRDFVLRRIKHSLIAELTDYYILGFYNNEYKLLDFFTVDEINDILHDVLNILATYRNEHDFTDEDIIKMENGEINDVNRCTFLGLYKSFIEILKHEDNNEIYLYIFSELCREQHKDMVKAKILQFMANLPMFESNPALSAKLISEIEINESYDKLDDSVKVTYPFF